MRPETILRLVDCCSCGKNLSAIGTRFINFIQTGKSATWDNPTIGNVITGDAGEAIAIVCDHCLEQPAGAEVKQAVEFRDMGHYTHVYYHDLSGLDEAVKSPQLMEAAAAAQRDLRNGGAE